MIRAVLTDIEGTTGSIRFVRDVLFPYAARELPRFIEAHRGDPDVQQQLLAVAAEAGLPPDDTAGLVATLQGWIETDRKATPLKALQGMIWVDGYRDGDYRAHIYPDVAPALEAWKRAGLRLYVYSSGSIEAQQLFFGYSEAGDLRHLFDAFFDTTSGSKQQVGSYRKIAAEIGLPAGEILFLSDVESELDAARDAGMATCQLVRPADGTQASQRHPTAADFTRIDPVRLSG